MKTQKRKETITIVAALVIVLVLIPSSSATKVWALDPSSLVAQYAKTNDWNERANIQAIAWKMFEVDDNTKHKLYAAEKTLLDKYVHKESQTYVGDTPVQFVYVDLLYRDIVVVLDPNQTKNAVNGYVTQENVMNDMMKSSNNIPLRVEYGKLQNLSCTSRTVACDPRIGGISISQAGQTSSDASTIGYQANDLSGNNGFVIAGHAAGAIGKTIVQPGGSGTSVGTVTKYCLQAGTCDFAFVKANSGINVAANIYNDGNTQFTIQNRILKSNQLVGTIVEKSGLTTGITFGQIYANSPNDPRIVIKNMNSAPGDSGSPIFTPLANNGANLYGMMYATSGGTDVFYFAWDTIKNTLGLQN